MRTSISTLLRRCQFFVARPVKMPKAAFYAVRIGRQPGIYGTWTEAEAQVKGFTGAKYKKFKSQAETEEFMGTTATNDILSTTPSRPATSRLTSQVSGLGSTSPIPPIADSSRGSSPPTHAIPTSLPTHLRQLSDQGWLFTSKQPYRLIVYTDGSGLGNGKKGAKAGLGVWWGRNGYAAEKNLSERVPGTLQTNNRGELLSVIRALETCPFDDLPLEIRTDSQYTIMCMTSYLPSWIKLGLLSASSSSSFLTSRQTTKASTSSSSSSSRRTIKNVDMIKHLLVLLRRRSPTAGVRFKYVHGHAGVEGNEGADRLAKMGANMLPLADRTNWLDPDTEDGLDTAPSAEVQVEIDEHWLMSPDELDQFEKGLEEV